jgi:hypothetical protein
MGATKPRPGRFVKTITAAGRAPTRPAAFSPLLFALYHYEASLLVFAVRVNQGFPENESVKSLDRRLVD